MKKSIVTCAAALTMALLEIGSAPAWAQAAGNFFGATAKLRQIAQDTSGYYLLSFEPKPADAGKGFSKVTVRTKNPEFVVRTRRGYGTGS